MTQVVSADSQDHRKYDKMSAQIQLKRHMGSFSLSYSTVKSWAERLKLPFRASDEAGQIAVHCRLLDSDVRVTRKALRHLLRVLVKHDDICAAGSALVDLVARNLDATGKATSALVPAVHAKVRTLADAVRGTAR